MLLTDTDNFTVITDDEGVKIVIGYAEINTNRVTLYVETESYDKIENVSFNGNLFRDVLVANKECESATLEVSSQGWLVSILRLMSMMLLITWLLIQMCNGNLCR